MNSPVSNIQVTTTHPLFFTVQRDKQPETLKHCFLGRMMVDTRSPPVILEAANKQRYIAIYQFAMSARKPTEHPLVDCIISFQAHTFGNYAIVRRYTPEAE